MGIDKTKIDWADSTWNPVTGCLRGCEYCYARGIARRFAGFEPRCGGETIAEGKGTYPKSIYNSTHGEATHIFHRQPMKRTRRGVWQKAPYPYGFEPTFHSYRLDEYLGKTGRTIFVSSRNFCRKNRAAKTAQRNTPEACVFLKPRRPCSSGSFMGDLFGEFIPVEWIEAVFEACAAAPQHRYLFLTKNPLRYIELAEKGALPVGGNYWFGSTATTQDQPFWWSDIHNTFVSIEPIHGPFDRVGNPVKKVDWVIIGAESGNRAGKVIPAREWIDNIVDNCRNTGVYEGFLAGYYGQ